MIVCVRIPAFAAAVEERDNSHLRRQPFVFIDPGAITPIVRGVSSNALSRGVRVGMTLRQAQTLYPKVELIVSNPARVHRTANTLMETLAAFTDLVEMETALHKPGRSRRPQIAIGADEGDGMWFMNPGRLRRDQGYDLALTVLELVKKRVELDTAVGLAGHRFTARVAAAAIRPRDIWIVGPKDERNFLAPFPVGVLPLYPEQSRQLGLLGIHTLGELASLPASVLGDLFGKQGASFRKLAEGTDTTPIQPYIPRREESSIRQFDDPVSDLSIIHNVIEAEVSDLSRKLETRGQMAGDLVLAMMLSGGGSQLTQIVLYQPSASAVRLTRAFDEMLYSLPHVDSVKEIEIILGGIVEAEARQLSMFPVETVPEDRLREVLPRLIARYGPDTFFWASLADPDELVPELRYRLLQAEAA